MTTTKRADRLALGDVIQPDKNIVGLALDGEHGEEEKVVIQYRDAYTPPDCTKSYRVPRALTFTVLNADEPALGLYEQLLEWQQTHGWMAGPVVPGGLRQSCKIVAEAIRAGARYDGSQP